MLWACGRGAEGQLVCLEAGGGTGGDIDGCPGSRMFGNGSGMLCRWIGVGGCKWVGGEGSVRGC
eukprot:11229909-Prorocentrum_lima.AAC.1